MPVSSHSGATREINSTSNHSQTPCAIVSSICQMFLCESFFLSLLEDNPLIVKVEDMFIHENAMYMVMEYCSGGTMQEFLDGLKQKV